MEIITRQTLANGAAEKWHKNHFKNGSWPEHWPKNAQQIFEQLTALGGSPDPNEVDRIHGVKGWTDVPLCNECNNRTAAVAGVGEEFEYDSRSAYLCLDCAKKAYESLAATIDRERQQT